MKINLELLASGFTYHYILVSAGEKPIEVRSNIIAIII